MNKLKMLICQKDAQRSCNLPEGYKYWLQGIDAHTEDGNKSDKQCSSSHHAVLPTQLSERAAKWRDIGTSLGFRQGELDNIECVPSHFIGAPKSWLSVMLSEQME